MGATQTQVGNYFVDEAGDTTLFSSKGEKIVGENGVSKFFMIGAAHLPDPDRARKCLNRVRGKLIHCPYFSGVPSMDPTQNKTAKRFHACDDLPEVRWEVFRAIKRLQPKVTIAIRRKHELAAKAANMFKLNRQKIREHEIYDGLVEETFKHLLHEADENRIVYAIRGKNPREKAFEHAIAKARESFEREQGITCNPPTKIQPAQSSEFAGLQVIDYYLWAIQRLFERRESRFFAFVAGDYVTIKDLDDNRNSPGGEYYGIDNPLALHKIKPLTG